MMLVSDGFCSGDYCLGVICPNTRASRHHTTALHVAKRIKEAYKSCLETDIRYHYTSIITSRTTHDARRQRA